MRGLKAGVVYFLLIFAVGWILGPIRELWAVPYFGRMAAMLSEAVIMLIAMQHAGSLDGSACLEHPLRRSRWV